ncbi:hypothetical protein CDAR_204231 [Caerostris darwini]|uniref:Uncharacterized protein n=1 Tax=Caerostris darwini TaxID=1538125 RepID=A0AAV4UNZ4_9ARAC|nr:hypothetical protein CDAR_204231 [Caerostris darwini]
MEKRSPYLCPDVKRFRGDESGLLVRKTVGHKCRKFPAINELLKLRSIISSWLSGGGKESLWKENLLSRGVFGIKWWHLLLRKAIFIGECCLVLMRFGIGDYVAWVNWRSEAMEFIARLPTAQDGDTKFWNGKPPPAIKRKWMVALVIDKLGSYGKAQPLSLPGR